MCNAQNWALQVMVMSCITMLIYAHSFQKLVMNWKSTWLKIVLKNKEILFEIKIFEMYFWITINDKKKSFKIVNMIAFNNTTEWIFKSMSLSMLRVRIIWKNYSTHNALNII